MTLAALLPPIIVLGICDFFTWIPFMLRMVFKPLQFLHQFITSDIPGNIHAFDNAVISLFRTLPEPSNSNLVHTRVPLPSPSEKDTLIVRGTFPCSRMNSLSVYGNQVEEPNSMEITRLDDNHEDSRQFAIELRRSSEMPKDGQAKNILECKDHWVNLMVVMRNYLVPPGTVIFTPEIIRKSDGRVVRKSQRLVAGPSALDVSNFRYATRVPIALAYHVLVWLWNAHTLSQTKMSFQEPHFIAYWMLRNTLTTLGGLFMAWALRHLMFVGGKYRLKQIRIAEINQFGQAGLDEASCRSQPSKLHTYFFMEYDLNQPDGVHELRVTSKIDESRQKYWSMIVYDEYGIPLSQYVFDGNCHHKNRESATKYEVDIRMRPGCHGPSPATPEITYFDVGKATRGYVAFRLVHPKDKEIIKYSSPKAELLPLDNKKTK